MRFGVGDSVFKVGGGKRRLVFDLAADYACGADVEIRSGSGDRGQQPDGHGVLATPGDHVFDGPHGDPGVVTKARVFGAFDRGSDLREQDLGRERSVGQPLQDRQIQIQRVADPPQQVRPRQRPTRPACRRNRPDVVGIEPRRAISSAARCIPGRRVIVARIADSAGPDVTSRWECLRVGERKRPITRRLRASEVKVARVATTR